MRGRCNEGEGGSGYLYPMRNATLFTSSIASAQLALCQPVIHAADHLPVVGTSRIFYSEPANGLVPETGEALYWDFSWLTYQNPVPVNYQSAADVPEAVALGATVRGYEGYLGLDASGLMDYAHGSSYNCSPLVFDYPLRLLPTTMTYGDSAVCAYGGGCGDLYGAQEFGDDTTNANGYGILEMPWGTVENVLRLASKRWGAFITGPPQEVDSYRSEKIRFYHPDAVEPIVTIEHLNVYPQFGEPWESSTITYIMEIGLGVGSTVSDPLTVWPVPAQDRLNLRLNKPITPGTRVELFDAMGRMARSEIAAPLPGNPAAIGIDCGTLATGGYMVRLTGPEGYSGCAHFVKD